MKKVMIIWNSRENDDTIIAGDGDSEVNGDGNDNEH